MPDPVTPPVPIQSADSVGADYRYALITGAVTAVVAAILAFLPITAEQKAAVMGAAVACGGLFAYIFISNHKATVQAVATVKAALVSAMNVPDAHPRLILARTVSYQQGYDDAKAGRPMYARLPDQD